MIIIKVNRLLTTFVAVRSSCMILEIFASWLAELAMHIFESDKFALTYFEFISIHFRTK